MGGIDQIMTDYLSSKDLQLSQSQLDQIQQIFDCKQQTFNPPSIDINNTASTSNNLSEINKKTWIYTCSKTNIS